MNADDQKLTQPENRDNDEEETLVTSETNALATPNEESATGETDADESAEPVQPTFEMLDDESEAGETDADESAEPVQPTFETLDDESETGETDADQSAEPIPPVIETLDKTALNSAAPPRIVSETPLGGVPKPRAVMHPEPPPAAPVEKYEIDDITKEVVLRTRAKKAPSPADVTPAEPTPPEAVEPVPAAPVIEPAPAAPDQPPSRVMHTEPTARPADWEDEDISPELAAVLFGERTPKADTPPAPAAQAPASVPVEAPAPKAVTAEPPAESISLTSVEAARRLPITAHGNSAAAPEAVLPGKSRYMRIEEPLKGDKGQRTTESWHYFKPDYPSLEGRLVKSVESEEILYADGSWRWEYQRRYSDGGRDRREVRANIDRSYIERHDEVSKLAVQAGKRVQYKEEAAMILSEPEREEKHGFLSGLLGRDDDETSGGAKVWREATASESRHARKNGGEALRRRFLGIF